MTTTKFELTTIKNLLVIGTIIVLLSGLVLADADTTTLTWVIPSNVAHTLSYGASCSTSAMYFVENDATADGTDQNILPREGNTVSDTNCQSDSVAAITVTNAGNVVIDVNAAITSSIQAGVTLKAWLGSSGCGGAPHTGLVGSEDTCTNTGKTDATIPTTILCVAIGDTNVQLAADIATSGTQQICLSADFSGLSQGETTDTLETTAWTSED